MKNYKDEMIALEEQITSARETFFSSRRETEKAGDQLGTIYAKIK